MIKSRFNQDKGKDESACKRNTKPLLNKSAEACGRRKAHSRRQLYEKPKKILSGEGGALSTKGTSRVADILGRALSR